MTDAAKQHLKLIAAKRASKRRLTKQDRLLELMADGQWHSARELALRVSHRFGAYLFDLKEEGVFWEKRLSPDRFPGELWYDYRLTDSQGRLFDFEVRGEDL